MRSIFFLMATVFLMVSFNLHNAFAFSVDETSANNKDGSAKFSDPDDKIPFPHVADDGQPTNNFQAQPVGNSGVSFSLTPSRGNEPDAFRRAQENRQ